MDKLIFDSEKYDLSTNDLLRITEHQTNIISYDDLQHINNINEILNPFGCCIILYNTTKNFGHWVSLILHPNNELEFFDPYGYKVDEELFVIDNLHLRKDGIHNTPHLTYLINNSNYKIISNNKQLQTYAEDVNTCGRWAALRIRFRDYKLEKFISKMTNNKCYNGDFWVSVLTILI